MSDLLLRFLISYQHKLIIMRVELASLNHCAVPFFSREAANLRWTYSSIGHSASTVVLRLSRGLQKEATEISVRFGSVRGSVDFGRFGSAKILPNFLSFNLMLTYNIRA